jgi:toxin ParE1/3/4
MARELIVSSRADADLSEAFAWYESRVPGLGIDFVRRVDVALQLVQRSPQLFRPRRGPNRMAMMARFPYAIYFIWDETADRISVRRILHFSQNAPAHLDP